MVGGARGSDLIEIARREWFTSGVCTSGRNKVMGMFAQEIAEANPTDGTGMYFLPGQYPLVQVDRLKLFESKDPKKGKAELFVIVCDVLDSQVQQRPAGTRGVAQTLNSNHPSAKDDGKRFISALFPSVTNIDGDGVKALTSDEQPAHGRLLSLECYEKVNEKTGKKFTKHIWRSVPDELQEKAAELRAKAGLTPF